MLQFVVLKASCLLLLANSIYASMANEATDEAPKAATSALGALYRTARDGYRTYDARCTTCGYNSDRSMRYDDRMYDNYYDYRRGSYQGGNMQGRGGYEDRNWYYQPDRYDDRYRNYDRYSGDKYGSRYSDDRYGYGYNSRPSYDDRYDYRAPSSGYYDRYDNMPMRYPSNDYRGNGYDNRDAYNMEQMRGDYNRGSDRFYGSSGYDRDYNYQRPSTGGYGGYDYRNYRPYDETYRGISGFDNSGRGYYFASRPSYNAGRPSVQPHLPPPPPSYQAAGRPQSPYDSTHKPAHYLPTNGQQNGNSDNDHRGSSGGNSADANRPPYDNRAPQYGSSSGHTGDVPTPGLGSGTEKGYAGGWSYENDRNNVHSSNKDKDSTSASYGSRPRPLGTSYLHEREESSEMEKKMNDEHDKPAEQTESKDKDNTQ